MHKDLYTVTQAMLTEERRESGTMSSMRATPPFFPHSSQLMMPLHDHKATQPHQIA